MQYLAIIEPTTDGGYSAYVPDLPLCFTVGDTLEEVKANLKEAVELYLEELKEEGKAITQPTPKIPAFIDVEAA